MELGEGPLNSGTRSAWADHHRRGLPHLEARNVDPGRRGQRTRHARRTVIVRRDLRRATACAPWCGRWRCTTTARAILSRTAPEFLEKLFEQEVPEVADGLITIKRIARAGRAPRWRWRGRRPASIRWRVRGHEGQPHPRASCAGCATRTSTSSTSPTTSNCSSSARCHRPKIGDIKLDVEASAPRVGMKPDQVALAIGKGGHNIKLAGRPHGLRHRRVPR